MIKNTLLLSFFLVLGVSCQKNNSDLLQEAQSCLNTAPASEARACVEKISSLTTPTAYKLKCSAIYISEGYGAASSLISALEEINKSTTGYGCSGGQCSSTLTVMTKFKFSSGNNGDVSNRDRNIATADEAVDTCQGSQSKAYMQVSSLFKMGTLANMKAYQLGLNPAQEPTVSELESAIPSLPPDEIGELVSVTYNSTCLNNQSPSEAAIKYCAELSNSIGAYGNNYTAIGNCLLSKLNNPGATCP